MKVRLLKDWNYHKQGDIVEVFEPTGKNWILNGIATEPTESRSVVEQAVLAPGEGVERAVRKPAVARK